MNRGIYPILSGALAHERRMQVFANNMANVNTAGFKQDQQAFKALLPPRRSIVPVSGGHGLLSHVMARPVGVSERVYAAPDRVTTTFEPGRIRLTGNPLDMAIQGEGFFEVKTPYGLRYTRNGMFSLDGQRRLVTSLGYPVMGTAGEIKIPVGKLEITSQGAVKVDEKPVATIKLVEFPPDEMPQKASEGLFVSDKGKPAKHSVIEVGHIEESNVNVIEEMVKLMIGMRGYESAQKLIQTLDRMAETAIQDVGRVG
ncbi:MAG: flagellar hook basal-body protein [Nitrospira sp.]|nr:flagellar hook basal-body protein [Nitrospira sp.]MCP9442997.1 flagellar hook basal-body protein [Nitrospira sp.]